MLSPSTLAPSGATPSTVDELFAELSANHSVEVRNAIVARYSGFARSRARIYRNRGVDNDDLDQVALLGLVAAVDRYRAGVGASFAAFAGVTIDGTIKRYFRDMAWSVRVPRSAKELHLQVRSVTEDLHQELRRPPTAGDVAARLGISVESAVVARMASAAYSSVSLDAPGSAEPVADDGSLAAVDDALDAKRLVGLLPTRLQDIVRLRFGAGLTQAEIGAQVGLSQMQISRLLRQALDILRSAVDLAPAELVEAASPR